MPQQQQNPFSLLEGFGLGGSSLGGLFGGSSPVMMNFGGSGGLGSLFGGGGLGSLFSGGNLAGGLAGMGGGLLSNAMGIESNPLGMVGGIGGSFFGPLGSVAGSFLGNALGGALGMGAPLPPRARANYIYDFASGSPTMKGGKGYDSAGLDAFGNLTDQIGDTAKSVFEQLGIAAPVENFGFGAFKGRSGFALPTDPWVRDTSSPGAFNSIGNSNKLNSNGQARAAGRVFGQSENRTDVPTGDVIGQAAQAALNALVTEGISKAGLTNADVFGKLGLPTDLTGFQTLLGERMPDFQFGSMDFAAPSTFTYADLAAANQLKAMLGQPTSTAQPNSASQLLSALTGGPAPFWDTPGQTQQQNALSQLLGGGNSLSQLLGAGSLPFWGAS